jgi:uncharacterized protein with PIN domain
MPGALARRMRERCSECGAGVRWFTRRQAIRNVDLAGFVEEAELVLGMVESVWQCVACGDVGAFGRTEYG